MNQVSNFKFDAYIAIHEKLTFENFFLSQNAILYNVMRMYTHTHTQRRIQEVERWVSTI